jgi:hypothetical protein
MSKGRREGRPEPSRSQDRGDPRDTPAQAKPATYRPEALAEPVIVAKWWKNRRGEAILVRLSHYEGHNLVDVRNWYSGDDGKLKPGKGFAATVKHLPELAKAIQKAEVKARELGLITDGAGHD